jgi:tRNA(Ile)-lysidine synthase
MRVVREVRQFMGNWPGPGVVGVSGGADSVALLRALSACGIPLSVAHVNHKLRGADSDGDETFVRELCATLGVRCRVKSVDVSALATGENLESTARGVRYEFFADMANEVGAAWAATAHTADDQAETVLHRLIRGTGLQGLRGIAAVKNPPPHHPSLQGGGSKESESNSVFVSPQAHSPLPAGRGAGGVGSSTIRPLLTLTRADVLAYLAAINQPYREDTSNADPRFTRNRIRHELLPLLKTFNPDVVSALTHLAEHASETHEVITAAASELLTRAERPRTANTLVLDAATLTASPRAVLRAALRLLWEREGWPMGDMSFEAWDRAVEIAGGNAPAADFPSGVSMRRAGRVVQLVRRE